MKTILLVMISTISSFLISSNEFYYNKNQSNLNVYESPFETSRILFTLKRNEKVKLLGQNRDRKYNPGSWLYIMNENNEKGWIDINENYINHDKLNKYYFFEPNKYSVEGLSKLTKKDFEFIIYDNSIILEESIESIIDKIGISLKTEIKQRSKDKIGLWDDFFYEYDGFKIHSMRNWQQVFGIKVTDNPYIMTSKKIKIGSSRMDVIETYGESYVSEELLNYSIYLDDGYWIVLWFKISNNIVTSFGMNTSAD